MTSFQSTTTKSAVDFWVEIKYRNPDACHIMISIFLFIAIISVSTDKMKLIAFTT